MLVHCLLLVALLALLQTASTRRFTNIARNPHRSGLHYSRKPSRTNKAWNRILRRSLKDPIPFFEAPSFPWGVHGQPGVAVGDFNDDGWDDIFVTNGPGRANSLFINQYPKTNKLHFRDLAREKGITSKGQDSTGVCYGDLNGDGLVDFVVLSEYDANHIFLGTSTGFRNIDWATATGDKERYPSTSCSIGDVDGDGHLDLFIANAVPKASAYACLAVPFNLNPPNQLFINRGRSKTRVSFKDVSFTSGINNYGGTIPKGKYTLSWAGAFVDVNLDGHLDIVVADDQCGLQTLVEDPVNGGTRGGLRIQLGDGKGNFTSNTLIPVDAKGNNRYPGGGNWMGLGFGDFNCDGKLDFFASNAGDYHGARFDLMAGRGLPNKIGRLSSRWWLGTSSANFVDASIKELGATVFSWGNAVFDYDNDGDQDIVSVGSLAFGPFAGSTNPNVIFKNSQCRAKFKYDLDALEPTGTTRNYQGLAIGDFNRDGYPDVVSACGQVSKKKYLSRLPNYESVLDKTAFFTEIMDRVDNNSKWRWNGKTLGQGDMMVQINSETDKSKCWVSVQPVGMKGVVEGGKINRGALGSTIIVKPDGLRAVMAPVIGGESFGSQHSARKNFGLGKTCSGTVDILWPQGVRNRLYGVKHGEVLTFPEIPCSFSGKWNSENDYERCVVNALDAMLEKKIISKTLHHRLHIGAMTARKLTL